MKSSGIGFIWYILVFLLVFMLCINFIRISTGSESVKSMSLINTLQDLNFSINSFRDLFQQNLVYDRLPFPSPLEPNFWDNFKLWVDNISARIADPFDALAKFIIDISKLLRSFFAIIFGYPL